MVEVLGTADIVMGQRVESRVVVEIREQRRASSSRSTSRSDSDKRGREESAEEAKESRREAIRKDGFKYGDGDSAHVVRGHDDPP